MTPRPTRSRRRPHPARHDPHGPAAGQRRCAARWPRSGRRWVGGVDGTCEWAPVAHRNVRVARGLPDVAAVSALLCGGRKFPAGGPLTWTEIARLRAAVRDGSPSRSRALRGLRMLLTDVGLRACAAHCADASASSSGEFHRAAPNRGSAGADGEPLAVRPAVMTVGPLRVSSRSSSDPATGPGAVPSTLYVTQSQEIALRTAVATIAHGASAYLQGPSCWRSGRRIPGGPARGDPPDALVSYAGPEMGQRVGHLRSISASTWCTWRSAPGPLEVLLEVA